MKKVLSKLKKGQSGSILEINIEELRRKMHLLELGITRGTKIKIKKNSLSGTLISIEIRGYELCISKIDADKILVNV